MNNFHSGVYELLLLGALDGCIPILQKYRNAIANDWVSRMRISSQTDSWQS
jgi:hypothetical protein